MKHGELTFVHIPFTGGHAIMEASGVEWEMESGIELRGKRRMMNDLGNGYHPPMQALAPHAGSYVFTVVRNPWEWLIDIYEHRRVGNEPFKEWFFGKGIKLPEQTEWFNGYEHLVQVFRYEHLEPLASVLSTTLRTNVFIPPAPELYNLTDYYDEDMKQLVVSAFRKDIKRFGFEWSSS